MKKIKKTILSLYSLSMLSVPITTLSSCGSQLDHSNKYTVNLSASEGVSLQGKVSFTVKENTKWKDIEDKPTVSVESGLTIIGWVDLDNYLLVTDETEITNNKSFKYVAYDPTFYTAEVRLCVEENEIVLPFFINHTWGEFVEMYELDQHAPTKKGYKFTGWYINGIQAYDDFVIESSRITAHARFIELTYTVNFSTDGNGQITGKKQLVISRDKKWSDLTLPSVEPNEGYGFDYWSVNGQRVEHDFAINSDLNVVAHFVLQTSQDAFEFELNSDHTASVIGLNTSFGILDKYIIPPTITVSDETYNVTSIKAHAFDKGKDKIEAIILGSNITTLQPKSFQGLTTLKYAVLNENLKTIGDCAFYDCANLVYANIPTTCETIEPDVFEGCNKLSYVQFDDRVHAWHVEGARKVDIWNRTPSHLAYCLSSTESQYWNLKWIKTNDRSEFKIDKKNFKNVDGYRISEKYDVGEVEQYQYLTFNFSISDGYALNIDKSYVKSRQYVIKENVEPEFGENLLTQPSVVITNEMIKIPANYVLGDIEIHLEAEPESFIVDTDNVDLAIQSSFPTSVKFGSDYYAKFNMPSNYDVLLDQTDVKVGNVSVKGQKGVRISRFELFIPKNLINGRVEIIMPLDTWVHSNKITSVKKIDDQTVDFTSSDTTNLQKLEALNSVCTAHENGNITIDEFAKRFSVAANDGSTESVSVEDYRTLLGSTFTLKINDINFGEDKALEYTFRIVGVDHDSLVSNNNKKAALTIDCANIWTHWDEELSKFSRITSQFAIDGKRTAYDESILRGNIEGSLYKGECPSPNLNDNGKDLATVLMDSTNLSSKEDFSKIFKEVWKHELDYNGNITNYKSYLFVPTAKEIDPFSKGPCFSGPEESYEYYKYFKFGDVQAKKMANGRSEEWNTGYWTSSVDVTEKQYDYVLIVKEKPVHFEQFGCKYARCITFDFCI